MSSNKFQILSNQENIRSSSNNISGAEFIKKAKEELFESLSKTDDIANRNNLSKKLSEKIGDEGYPKGYVIFGGKRVRVDGKKFQSFKDLYDEVNKEQDESIKNKKLDDLNRDFAERLILDSGSMIEFGYDDNFEGGLSAEQEAKKTFEKLNKLDDYKDKIERAKKILGDETHFVVKRTEEQIKIFKAMERVANEEGVDISNDEEIEEKIKENNENIQKMETFDPNNEWGSEYREGKDKKISELKEKLENAEEKNEELTKKAKELEKKLLENKNLNKESKIESLEKVNLEKLVNRDNLADAIYKIRVDREYPLGSIEIRSGVFLDISKEPYYNKYKEKYIEAKDNDARLKDLDTEFAEHIILGNPKMTPKYKQYYIQINNDNSEKTEEELIQESLKCRDSLINQGYNVEYVVHEEKSEINIKEKERKERELQEMLEEEKRQLRKIEELESELDSKRLHVDEKDRVAKQEELRKLKLKLDGLQREVSVLLKEIEELTKPGKRHHIIRQKKQKELLPHEEEEPIPYTKTLEMNSVISDMGTDVHREKVSLNVEEELRDEYKSTAWFNIPKRAYLFLSRGAKRKRRIKREMNAIGRDSFTGDATINSKFSDAADRHQLELKNNLDAVAKANTVAFQNPQVNALCEQYLQGTINDARFETDFNAIIAADAIIQSALDGQDITHTGTNILLKLQQQRAKMQLNKDVENDFNNYISTGSQVHLTNINRHIENYIKTYQTNPDFMKDYEDFINAVPGARNRLQLFLRHQGAVMKMQTQNVRMNIDVLVKGKSAYQIDNKDRQKNWKYKVGNFLDKLPRWVQTAGFIGVSVGTGLLTGGLGTVAAAAITTGVTASSVGGVNAIKKYAHHTKEQNTHEKNVVTDYRNEQKKIAEWQNQALNGKRHQRKTYKAKRQLALYDQTTQENINVTHTITDSILDLSSKVGSLTPKEDNYMKKNLIEGWTRLKYYRDRGHNFLASNENDKVEKDFKELEKSLILGLGKVGLTNLSDIETISATDDLGSNITYDTIKKDLRNSYDKSLVQFKRERRNLALKYGIGTAALSAGMSVGMQYVMGTGIFSGKGTPEVPGSTFTDNTTENFDLGKHDLLDVGTKNDIYDTGLDVFSNPKFNGNEINIEFGAGTDATPVVSGNLTELAYTTKVSDVISNIKAMDLSPTQKTNFIDFINSDSFHLNSGTQVNDNLHGMRCLEFLEQTAKSLSDSGNTGAEINLSYNPDLNVSPEDWYDATERVVNANYNVEIPPTEGPGPSGRGTYLQAPLFFNTFKDKKVKKDKDNKDKENGVVKGNKDNQKNKGELHKEDGKAHRIPKKSNFKRRRK
ncbi:MAG TPA: hypothetical protein VJ892_03985 [Candidatus Absconditabacterales bacterium]|nr:hypothetical protein [Candidatus Absconditabacterales bacterium]